jgi:disease resistance protein RPM1
MAELVLGVYAELLSEVTKRAVWKFRLREDLKDIRSGNTINEAEQQLLEIENCINYASFIIAGAGETNEPNGVRDWIDKAQIAVFSLEDQIAMYRIQGLDLNGLISMKSAIGKSSINELTLEIKEWIGKKPNEVKEFESNSSKSMEQVHVNHPFIRYSKPVGADGTISIMGQQIQRLRELVDISNNISVIFIIGGKGSGRTTLMNSLCQDSYVKNSFSHLSWVKDAGKITDLAGLLRMVLTVKDNPPKDADVISELEIMNKIQDTFHGEGKGCYLIVLDDVEDTCALHTLKHVLKGCKGKIICLTTRKDILQEFVDADKEKESGTLEVPPLAENDAHKLFMHAAFPGYQEDEFKEEDRFKKAIEWRAEKKLIRGDDLQVTDVVNKSKVLDKVLEECMGNPWNVQAVGRLFAAHPFDKWEEIQKRIDGVLIDGNRGIGKPDPPIELKDPKLSIGIWRSFLYCLAFPEGSEISARKLARLWMAEGFVQDSPLHSQEHQAERLVEDLIEKNLLVEKTKDFDGKVLKCSVNNHIRDLALHMCKLQKFCKFVPDDQHPASLSDSPTSRYRVLSVHGDTGVKELMESEMLRKDIRLRSLLYFGNEKMQREEFKISFRPARRWPIGRTNSRYRLLRTLELQGARLNSLPHSIGWLVCLRYLGLRNTQLENLPASMNRLTKLLCLDIRDTKITSLDDVSVFTEMRHLHLAKSFRGQSVVISEGLRSLVYLRTLSGAGDGGNLEQELSQLSFLRKISIKVSSTSSKNICAAISNMGFLQSLAVTVYDEDPSSKDNENTSDPSSKDNENTSEGEGVEPLEEGKTSDGKPLEKKEKTSDGKPLKKKEETPDKKRFDIGSLKIGGNIRKLKLGGDMGRLCADRVTMMHSVTYLYLWDSKLDVDVLLRLQDLHNLLLLSLCNTSTCLKLSCTRGGYRKLKKLSLISMKKLTECEFGKGAMWNLEVVVFAKCDELSLPPKGIRDITSLQMVYWAQMPDTFGNELQKLKKTELKRVRVEEGMPFHRSTRTPAAGSQTTAAHPVTPSR